MKSNSKIITGTLSATAASSVTAQFDCTGYNYCKIVALGNNVNIAASSGNTVVESETSGGTTNSVFAQADITRNTAATTSSSAKMVWGIPMAGRKPFLKATFTPDVTGQYWLVAELSDPVDTASTRAQAAVGSYCNI